MQQFVTYLAEIKDMVSFYSVNQLHEIENRLREYEKGLTFGTEHVG